MARRQPHPIREKSLSALAAYLGPASGLVDLYREGVPPQRLRTFSQAAPDDVSLSLATLTGLRGAAVAVHASAGCALAPLGDPVTPLWAVTGLTERDTIMGSGQALAVTVRRLVRQGSPWSVFVVTGPAVAINNDEVRGVSEELEQELGLPVIPVAADGFRSKVAATGWDLACRALLGLVPVAAGPREPDLVNVLTVSRDGERWAVNGPLAGLGLRLNVLPRGAGPEAFALASRAALTVSLEPDATLALAEGLKIGHGVPFLDRPAPIGLGATAAWLEEVLAALGRSGTAEAVAGREASQAAFRDSPLAGAHVYLALPAWAALPAARLVLELGGRLAGLGLDHVDARHIPALAALEERQQGLTVRVGAGQPFEEASLLRRLKPDLFVGEPERALWAARAGVNVVPLRPGELLGGRGAATLALRAGKALANPAFVRSLARHPGLPFTSAWLGRSPDWHIKQEVR